MHRFANPARFLKIARPATGWLLAIGVVLIAIGAAGGLFVTPPDYLQGETSMLILLFLYFGYIALSAAERERGPDGRVSAIFGLVGAVNIPIIHFSVQWWNTLHQAESIELTGTTIAPELLWPLPFTLFGFSALFGALVLMRMRTELAQTRIEARLKRAVAE